MTNKPTVLLIGAENEENLAIRTLAAYLRQNDINAEVIGFSQEPHTHNVLRKIRKNKPDVIAMSIAFQSLSALFFSLIEAIRANNYKGHIIVGGHFPTFEYRKILETQKGIDSIGRFEGEHCLAELVCALRDGGNLANIPNLVYRENGNIKENPILHSFPLMDDAPFPVRDRKPLVRLGEKFATLISSRGCWHSSCAYCCIGAFHRDKKQKFILRSEENTAKEIAYLHKKKGVCLFQFHDDNFVLPSRSATAKRISRLGEALRREGVSFDKLAFLIKARPDTIDDNVASTLAELGCVGVFLGIENASETGLKALIRKATLDDINKAVEALTRHGMIVTYNLLIFHPHATLDEINQNIEFAKKHPALPFDFGRAEIVAGSPLERLVNDEGRLLGTWPRWDYLIDDPIIQRMFEINAKTFRAHGSHYSPLIQSIIAMSYHVYALNHLHKGVASRMMLSESQELIATANRFVTERMERMRDMTMNGCKESDIKNFFDDIRKGCIKHHKGIIKLTNRMLRLQTAERVFGFFGVGDIVQQSKPLWRLFRFAPNDSGQKGTTVVDK